MGDAHSFILENLMAGRVQACSYRRALDESRRPRQNCSPMKWPRFLLITVASALHSQLRGWLVKLSTSLPSWPGSVSDDQLAATPLMTASRSVAFGLRAHSGWAVLVTVKGPGSNPTLLERRRIELAEHTPAQPYHEAAYLGDVALAAALIERARADARLRARMAISTAVAEAGRQGYGVRGAALLTSRARPLPTLDAILVSHPLLHAAEGELFRQALAQACEESRLAVWRCSEQDLYEESGRLLKIRSTSLRRQLTAIGHSCGPPWTSDHKAAFLAGWRVLAR